MSLADKTITFHDVVMMDDPSEHERLLDEVRTTYDLAQGIRLWHDILPHN